MSAPACVARPGREGAVAVPADSPDLTTRLAEAAVAAITNRRPAIEREPGAIKSITVELTLGPFGMVRQADAWVQFRIPTSAIVGVRG